MTSLAPLIKRMTENLVSYRIEYMVALNKVLWHVNFSYFLIKKGFFTTKIAGLGN